MNNTDVYLSTAVIVPSSSFFPILKRNTFCTDKNLFKFFMIFVSQHVDEIIHFKDQQFDDLQSLQTE